MFLGIDVGTGGTPGGPDRSSRSSEEGGAFEAALLADIGVGAWGSVEAAGVETVHAAEVIEPKDAATMNDAYTKFQRVYPALREIERP